MAASTTKLDTIVHLVAPMMLMMAMVPLVATTIAKTAAECNNHMMNGLVHEEFDNDDYDCY